MRWQSRMFFVSESYVRKLVVLSYWNFDLFLIDPDNMKPKSWNLDTISKNFVISQDDKSDPNEF